MVSKAVEWCVHPISRPAVGKAVELGMFVQAAGER